MQRLVKAIARKGRSYDQHGAGRVETGKPSGRRSDYNELKDTKVKKLDGVSVCKKLRVSTKPKVDINMRERAALVDIDSKTQLCVSADRIDGKKATKYAIIIHSKEDFDTIVMEHPFMVDSGLGPVTYLDLDVYITPEIKKEERAAIKEAITSKEPKNQTNGVKNGAKVTVFTINYRDGCGPTVEEAYAGAGAGAAAAASGSDSAED